MKPQPLHINDPNFTAGDPDYYPIDVQVERTRKRDKYIFWTKVVNWSWAGEAENEVGWDLRLGDTNIQPAADTANFPKWSHNIADALAGSFVKVSP